MEKLRNQSRGPMAALQIPKTLRCPSQQQSTSQQLDSSIDLDPSTVNTEDDLEVEEEVAQAALRSGAKMGTSGRIQEHDISDDRLNDSQVLTQENVSSDQSQEGGSNSQASIQELVHPDQSEEIEHNCQASQELVHPASLVPVSSQEREESFLEKAKNDYITEYSILEARMVLHRVMSECPAVNDPTFFSQVSMTDPLIQ